MQFFVAISEQACFKDQNVENLFRTFFKICSVMQNNNLNLYSTHPLGLLHGLLFKHDTKKNSFCYEKRHLVG